MSETKYELNKRLAELMGLCVTEKHNEFSPSSVIVVVEHSVLPWSKYQCFNPCENWNDLIPLAIEHGVSIVKIGHDEWDISYSYDTPEGGLLVGDFGCKGEDVQETIVKCLIAKLESEK